MLCWSTRMRYCPSRYRARVEAGHCGWRWTNHPDLTHVLRTSNGCAELLRRNRTAITTEMQSFIRALLDAERRAEPPPGTRERVLARLGLCRLKDADRPN